MDIWLGVDGGGTKTAYLLCDADGNVLASAEGIGSAYDQHEMETMLENILAWTERCMEAANCKVEEIKGACIGLTLVGENQAQDEKLIRMFAEKFPIPHRITNDAQVAFAGSLAGGYGINLVAGTGSIAFGGDESGETARAGGWSAAFGDEGSCHWVAKLGMQLFTRQADGRERKGALYDLVYEEFALHNDFAFVNLMESEYLPYRDKTASFQRVVLRAAQAGDKTAIALYEQAASELAALASALKSRLQFRAKSIPVSYSGGIFHAGSLILDPLSRLLGEIGMSLTNPIFSPVEGAALLARKWFSK